MYIIKRERLLNEALSLIDSMETRPFSENNFVEKDKSLSVKKVILCVFLLLLRMRLWYYKKASTKTSVFWGRTTYGETQILSG